MKNANYANWQHLETPLGPMVAKWSQDPHRIGALEGLWFYDQKHLPREVQGLKGGESATTKEAIALVAWLDAYFKGEAKDLPRLAPLGTPFQEAVWQLLLEIPKGATTTYGDLARLIAAQRGKDHFSAQAIGSAVGRNPIGILIPCHRVIGADGSLTGYAGGLERKAYLLALEAGS